MLDIKKEHVGFINAFLVVSEKVPLTYLNELFLEIETEEGESFFNFLDELFLETKNGNHFFSLPIPHQTKKWKVIFWEVINGNIIGKEFST